jgi:hypothetical protein
VQAGFGPVEDALPSASAPQMERSRMRGLEIAHFAEHRIADWIAALRAPEHEHVQELLAIGLHKAPASNVFSGLVPRFQAIAWKQ